jgi:hypothetical protein
MKASQRPCGLTSSHYFSRFKCIFRCLLRLNATMCAFPILGAEPGERIISLGDDADIVEE